MDVIFFALIAAFIAYRYYSILGKKDGDIEELEAKRRELAKQFNFGDFGDEEELKGRLKTVAPISTSENQEIIKVMETINKSFPEFNESFFVNGAKSMFEMVIAAFNREDSAPDIKPYVSEVLYSKINNEINRRKLQGEELEVTLVAFEKSEIIDAYIHKNAATIKIEFMTEQMIKHKNNMTKPHSEKIQEIWTFTKDMSNSSPVWILSDIK